VLEERERSRGNRITGDARAQVEVIHAGVEYDLILDTASQSPEECARDPRQACTMRRRFKGHF
jgi:chloramphenicol 3-O phosphotransferase